jgi:hypothetical protein
MLHMLVSNVHVAGSHASVPVPAPIVAHVA